jgi:hypothetical protein
MESKATFAEYATHVRCDFRAAFEFHAPSS